MKRIATLCGVLLLGSLVAACDGGIIDRGALTADDGGSDDNLGAVSLLGRGVAQKPHKPRKPRHPCIECGLDGGTAPLDGAPAAEDAGAPATDATPTPQHDGGTAPQDATPAPQTDATVPAPPPQTDAGAPPPQTDAGAPPPQTDAGAPPLAGYCYGDVPCAATLTRQPSPACAAAGANAHVVVSTAPSVSGYPETALPLPAVGTRVADPDFGSCITRATPTGWMNGYSRYSAINADASTYIVRQAGGAWYLLAADQLGTPSRSLPVYGDDAAPRWHGRDPDLLFYLSGARLVRYRVSTAATTTALDLDAVPELGACGGVSGVSLGGSEGDSSAGSRYWGFQVTTRNSCNGNNQHFVTADLETGGTWAHTLPAGFHLPDNSSMSLTGKYFIANYQVTSCGSTVGSLAHPCGVMAYDLHLTAAFMVHPAAGHHDEGLTKEGHDAVIVKSNSTDYIESIDLETRQLTRIAELNLSVAAWDYHISGGNWAMPGWVLVSEDSYNWNSHYLNRQIVAIELADAAVARVVHLAHHRTRSNDYWTQEPHASVNADFTRVAFHSNWYGGSAESANIMFVLELPPALLK